MKDKNQEIAVSNYYLEIITGIYKDVESLFFQGDGSCELGECYFHYKPWNTILFFYNGCIY